MVKISTVCLSRRRRFKCLISIAPFFRKAKTRENGSLKPRLSSRMVNVVFLKNNNYKGEASAERVNSQFFQLRPLKGLHSGVSGVTGEAGAG